MKKYVVGARGSTLSMNQTRWVLNQIKQKNPGMEFTIETIQTAGDLDKETALNKINNKNFFTDTIEQALLTKKIDIAIHSMKDLSSEMDDQLMLTQVPKREDPRDVLVLKETFKTLEQVPKNLTIGTSSDKRDALIKEKLPTAVVEPIRGNVDQRLQKVKHGDYDGTVLAAAGIHRLNLKNVIDFYFDPTEFIPAPAQGILAIQIRKEDQELLKAINIIADQNTGIQQLAEREFYRLSEDQYNIIGAYCEVKSEGIELFGILGSQDHYIKKSKKGKRGQERILAGQLYQEIIEELSYEE